jgi:small-conductance mechanosensitive channel
MARRMIKICLLMMFCCFVGAVPANAEESAAPAPQAETPLPEAEPVPLSAARIATRVDETTAEILRLFDGLKEPGPEIGKIPTEIDALAVDLDRVLQNVDREQISAMRQSLAETLLQTLNRMKRKLDTWHHALEQRTEFLDQKRQLIRQEISFLQELRVSGEAEDLPDSIVERIDTLSTQLEGARVAVGDRLDLALDELSRISTIDLRIRENAQLLKTRLSARASEVFALEDVPIWQIGKTDAEFTERLSRELRSRTDATKEYVKANANESVAMILFLAFLGVIGYLAHRSIRRLADSNAGEERTRAFLERPGAMVALLWAITGPELILPPLPVALVAMRVLVCAVALWRLIPTIMPAAEQSAVRPLIVLAAITAILMFWPAEEAYGRFALIVIDVLGIYWFRRFGRALRAAKDSSGLWQFIGRFITTLAPYLLSIGILGVLFGAVALAVQISRGLFVLLIAILSLMVVESLLNTLTESFLSGSGRRWLHLIQNHQELIQGRISFFIRLGMLILLVMFIPRMFPMLEGAATGVAAVLTQRVEFGTVSISLTTILGLFISVVIALAVARFVRIVLDEDVFPRLSVAPGAAAAASRLIYYALVLGGIIFALAASGVELSNLTLLVSALGVGIGFGLQGIVNNFVSGLVLAFERPFQTGDMIAVGELFGRVRQIGLRASRIRTFEGAEVIVPNANLISGEVINWTLSDQMRRGDIKVSVAYGSDTARVREELLKVAGNNERVARHPEPVALLLGFDDSSINFALRLWISEAGDWPEIASDLYDAVHVAFAEAGIEIPFPQRTVHLHDNRGPD